MKSQMMKKKSQLDWHEIQYLFPLAYMHFVRKMFPNTGIVSNILLGLFNQKYLYGFFDREGIFLNTEIIGSNTQWLYTIYSNGVTIGNNCSHRSREDAEVEGFGKCFEFLENKLII